MARETILFKSEERKTREQVAEVLRTIATKVEQGKLSISSGSQGVDLSIPMNVVLEIKVEEEVKTRKKQSLEIEIEWIEGDQGDSGSGVHIS